ncbi:MAG: hypothetical protein ACK4P3_04725 [Fimbriimonadaceae bacterium]
MWKKLLGFPAKYDRYAQTAYSMVRKGHLNPDESAKLDWLASQDRLSPSERQAAHAKAIERICEDILEKGQISPEDSQILNNAISAFSVDLNLVSPAVLGQLRQLNDWQQWMAGPLPVLPAGSTPLMSKPGEHQHLKVDCCVIQEKRVRSRSSGSFSGVSFRIARGVTYRVGGYGGQSVPVMEPVVVCQGPLILTSSRAVYLGTKHGFDKAWAKVNAIEKEVGGVTFFFSDRKNATTLTFLGDDLSPVVIALCHRLKSNT